jgi:hypothetical protein
MHSYGIVILSEPSSRWAKARRCEEVTHVKRQWNSLKPTAQDEMQRSFDYANSSASG